MYLFFKKSVDNKEKKETSTKTQKYKIAVIAELLLPIVPCHQVHLVQ
jgi:hypothetical protein